MYEAALGLSLATFIVAVIVFVRHPAFSIYHPLTMYICFHGLLFVFRPMVALHEQFTVIYDAFRFTPSPQDKLTVVLASNLGFVVFYIACLFLGSAPMQFKQDRYIFAEREKLFRIFPRVLAICVPIGAFSMYHFWSEISSYSAFSGMRFDESTGLFISTTENGYLLESQTMLASAVALIAWVYRFRLIALAPMALFFLLRAGTGNRGPIIAALAMAMLIYFYEKKQKRPTAKIVLPLVIAITAFAAIGANRGADIRYVLGFEQEFVRETHDEKFLEGMDFANLEFFEYIVYVVPKLSGTYDYFLDNLQVLTEPVPRSIWTGKPVGPPIKRLNLVNYGKPYGMTRSLPGEGWYAWGWLGVAIWCGLWGAALGRIYQRFATGPQNTLQTAAYMVFLPILIVAFRDGTLVTVFRQVMFYFFPVVVWFGMSRYMGLPSARTMRFAAYRKWRKMKAEQSREPQFRLGSTLTTNPAAPGDSARRR